MELTDGQRQAIHLDARRICVDAGAGSGKTFVLVERIVRLLKQGVPMEGIVAITFTEKAAAEMKARLRAACRKQAAGADAAEMSRWRDQEQAVETARITTIHAFCAGILREHALALGLDPDFAPLAEGEMRLLLAETARETLHGLLDAGDSEALHLCSAFRAGTLITLLADMLTRESLVNRVLERHPFDDVASLRAAWGAAVAQEREAQLMLLRDDPALRLHLKTLSGFEGAFQGDAPDTRALILRWQLDLLRLLSQGATWEQVTAAQAARAALGTNRAGKGWDKETAAELKGAQDAVADWLKTVLPDFTSDPDDEVVSAQLTLSLTRVFAQARAAFERAKQRSNRLSFDDLIGQTHAALRDSPALCAAVAQDMRALLIDEFQDTDAVQLEIAERLHGAPEGPSLFIVGDAKQSIYYFRGAEVEVFRSARGVADETIALSANFRTLPDVLHFVNDYFDRSAALHAVERDYAPMAPNRAASDAPCVEFLCVTLPGPSSMADLRREEADRIAAHISALLAPGSPPRVHGKDGALRPAAPGDFALLFRGMSHVGIYEDALRRAGIPYTLSSGAGFYQRQEVLDVLNALRVVLDAYDESALFAFLRGPMAGLSDEALFRLVRQHKNLARAFADAEPGTTGGEENALLAARALIAMLREHAEDPPGVLVRRLLEATGFEAVQLAQYLGVQKAANVRKLVAQADGFSHGGVQSLRAFVRYLSDISNEGVREGEAAMAGEGGAVSLMTIHKSKGLEFPVVFLVDTAARPRSSKTQQALGIHRDLGLVLRGPDAEGDPGRPVIAQAITTRAQREEQAEHARLLYVALTRARDVLYLSGGLKRNKEGEARPERGSWFDALDQVYAVTEKPAEAVLRGTGWQAVVRHEAPPALAAAPQRVASAPPDLASLAARIAPITPAAASRTTFPVSMLLDVLSAGPAQHRNTAEGGHGDPGAMLRGSLVHALFERWDFTTAHAPDLDRLLDDFAVSATQRPAWRADVQAIIARFAASDLAQRARAAGPVAREVPFFLYRPAVDAVVQGVVDAVLGDGVIVDYKTGHRSGANDARYTWQLRLYAAAYREIRGVQPTEGILYYVDEDVCVTVDFSAVALDAVLQEAEGLITRLRAVPVS
jgi:ATP-dependent helicase/nuclease subunit A